MMIMSEYINGEILEINGEPAEGVCLGAGYYPEDSKPFAEQDRLAALDGDDYD